MSARAGLPAAYLDGWHAHRLGRDARRNPYHEDDASFSFSAWEQGWSARFAAVKFGLDLSLDERLAEILP